MPAPRIERLKQATLGRVMDHHFDRARLVTEAYKATERQPIAVRRAKAIGRFIERAPIAIFDEELLVGDRSWVQPYSVNYPDERAKGKPQGDCCECNKVIDEIWPYWLSDRAPNPVSANSRGHCVPGFSHLLRLGFNGIAQKAKDRLDRLDTNEPNAEAKRAFLRAEIMLAKSCARIGARYARLAAGLAESATGQRREELLDIAKVCRQVPAKPPRNFREALQSLWFGQLLIESEDGPNAQSPGRVDQLLCPYYEADLASRAITREQAHELLCCLWLKLWAPYDVHGVVIGGVAADGSDASNELSEMLIDVQRDLNMRRQMSLRYHRNINPRLFAKVCDSLRDGLGVPQIFNDDVLVPALADSWVPKERAHDYSVIGCIEMTMPGEGDGRAVASYTNLPEALEWALFDGECPVAGKIMGARTGDPLSIQNYDDLWQRYRTQVRHMVEPVLASRAERERAETETYPMVLLSLLTEDCIETATDITAGGARYNGTMFCAVGIPNVADSLAAIKKLVFEEKRVTLAELLEAMRADFEGCEPLRQMLRNDAPKYGNDDDYVDQIALEVATDYCDALEGHIDPRGGPYNPSFFSFTTCVSMGKMVAASPDGRNATTPLANSLCAAQGNMRNGPSALLKSAGKLRQRQATGGTSMLLDLHPSMVVKDNGDDPLAAMLRTYFDDLGGSHAEVSLLDAKTLRDAQNHPDQYQDLSVRVAGYSARFLDLSRELQEHIIARLDQSGKRGG